MQMYPAYKLRDVLDEYAITFFALLDQGFRRRYENYLILSDIAVLPFADPAYRKELLSRLEWAATDPDDILNPETDNDFDDIKDFFRKI